MNEQNVTLSDLKELVQKVDDALSAIHFEQYGDGPMPIVQLAEYEPESDLYRLSDEFRKIVGPGPCNVFFGRNSQESRLRFLFRQQVDNACTFERNPTLQHSLNADLLTSGILDLASRIKTGHFTYHIAMHLSSVRMASKTALGPNVELRPLSREELLLKYSLDGLYPELSTVAHSNWATHNVEAVFTRTGTFEEWDNDSHIDNLHTLASSIELPFLWLGRQHVAVSQIRSSCPFFNLKTFFRTPPTETNVVTPLSGLELEALRRNYEFLQAVPSDLVLSRATERFLIGRKQSLAHPLRSNEPHWDKIVDYAIAMESLFLTVEGDPIPAELSYRFAVNGACLLSQCTSHDSRSLCHGLKELYRLRSLIVHGGSSAKCDEHGNAILEALGERRTGGFACLGVLTARVEGLLISAFEFLSRMEPSQRPYKKKGGWEELIWPSTNSQSLSSPTA